MMTDNERRTLFWCRDTIKAIRKQLDALEEEVAGELYAEYRGQPESRLEKLEEAVGRLERRLELLASAVHSGPDY